MSVEEALAELVVRTVGEQLRPLWQRVQELERALSPMKALFEALGLYLPGEALPARCGIAGCGRAARTKGYCGAHYQKLRLLIRTGRRPPGWRDHPAPDSVLDVRLPRGRAAPRRPLRAKR